MLRNKLWKEIQEFQFVKNNVDVQDLELEFGVNKLESE
jgi:hypothetical protein